MQGRTEGVRVRANMRRTRERGASPAAGGAYPNEIRAAAIVVAARGDHTDDPVRRLDRHGDSDDGCVECNGGGCWTIRCPPVLPPAAAKACLSEVSVDSSCSEAAAGERRPTEEGVDASESSEGGCTEERGPSAAGA